MHSNQFWLLGASLQTLLSQRRVRLNHGQFFNSSSCGMGKTREGRCNDRGIGGLCQPSWSNLSTTYVRVLLPCCH